MLVLSRKLGEKIYIGENICITVVDIDRGKIRLGIEAPRDVRHASGSLARFQTSGQVDAITMTGACVCAVVDPARWQCRALQAPDDELAL